MQRRGFAANLVLGVVVVGQILDLRYRQEAELRRADGHAEDALLVEQGVEDPAGTELLVELRGDAIDATALGNVLTEDQHLGVLGQQVAQRVVDRLCQQPRRLILGQTVGTAEVQLAFLSVAAGALGLGAYRVGCVRRQRCHHCGGAVEVGPAGGLARCTPDSRPDLVVQRCELRSPRQAGRHGAAGVGQERVLCLVGFDLLDVAVGQLDVRAGVTQQAHQVEVQEHRLTAAPAAVDGATSRVVGVHEVEPVSAHVGDAGLAAPAFLDPPGRRVHRDPEPIVLTDEQDGYGEVLVARPQRAVEGPHRGGVVHTGVAEAAHHDGVLGEGQGPSEMFGAPDGDRVTHRLGHVRRDGARLRVDPQRHGAEHLVASAGDGIVGCCRQRQEHVEDRRLPGQLSRPLHEEPARAVVQECRVVGPQRRRNRCVHFVAGAGDGVVTLVAVLQGARLEVELPHGVHRLEQLEEQGSVQPRARRHGGGRVGGRGVAGVAFEQRAQIGFEDLRATHRRVGCGKDAASNDGYPAARRGAWILTGAAASISTAEHQEAAPGWDMRRSPARDHRGRQSVTDTYAPAVHWGSVQRADAVG